MKKLFLSLMLAGAMCAQANVAYVLVGANTKNALPTEQSKVNYGTEEEPNIKTENQDPEINFANWFDDEYVFNDEGEFITVAEIATRAKDFDVIIINCDRVGLERDAFKAFFNAATVAALKTYVANGGNLYLSKQASELLYMMGRIGYEPGFGNGGYNKGGDVWRINPVLGLWPWCHPVHDNTSHAIFAGLTPVKQGDVLERKPAYEGEEVPNVPFYAFDMVGEDARTDNNVMWTDYLRKDPVTGGAMAETEGVTHYQNDNPLRYDDFVADWNCKPLACWGHVTDYCGMGICEWYGETATAGTIITNGFAAYQWGKTNSKLDNVKKLTDNIIQYLLTKTPTDLTNVENEVKTVKTVENGQVVIIKNGVRYNALGVTL